MSCTSARTYHFLHTYSYETLFKLSLNCFAAHHRLFILLLCKSIVSKRESMQTYGLFSRYRKNSYLYTVGSVDDVQLGVNVQFGVNVKYGIFISLNVFWTQSLMRKCHMSFCMIYYDFDHHMKNLSRYTDFNECTVKSGLLDKNRGFAIRSHTIRRFAYTLKNIIFPPLLCCEKNCLII